MEPLFLAGSIISLALFVLFFFKAELFLSLFRRVLIFLPEKIRAKIENLFDSFLRGFAISKYPGQFFMIIVSSYVIWGLYLLLMYLPFYAFDMINSNGLNFGSATVLMVVSTVAFAFPTPSGFGTYHSFTSFALTQLYHVDGVTALSYTILTHEIGVFITTVIGLYYFFKDNVRVTEMVKETE